VVTTAACGSGDRAGLEDDRYAEDETRNCVRIALAELSLELLLYLDFKAGVWAVFSEASEVCTRGSTLYLVALDTATVFLMLS
jgi:hypothetical protein